MTPRTVPCPACGEPAKPPPFSEPDLPWACSPCRAAWAGAIHLTLPWGCKPADIFLDRRGDPQALRESLLRWARALAAGTAGVLDLAEALAQIPDAEAVAHAVMGGLPNPDVSARDWGLELTRLAPEAARRLAQSCDLAEGPALSYAELVALREAREAP